MALSNLPMFSAASQLITKHKTLKSTCETSFPKP